jgi:hypothetical protein
VKRMIKGLAVAALVAVMLVVSVSPLLARPNHFGHNLHDNPSCEATAQAQNDFGAHHETNPTPVPPVPEGCWVVLPGQG